MTKPAIFDIIRFNNSAPFCRSYVRLFPWLKSHPDSGMAFLAFWRRSLTVKITILVAYFFLMVLAVGFIARTRWKILALNPFADRSL
ncbi:MAG: hypothetical protein U5K69_28280 [Balneolaceae bacterium]|nr:hypothetical protein [Balneolaceae bacterium]